MATTVTAALLAGSGAWAFASPDGPFHGPDSACSLTEVPTLAEASRLATECGHDVAALETFDPWSATVATPRGTLRDEVSAGAVRTDIAGDWQDVDPTVVVDPGSGELKVAAPVYDITLDPSGDDGFLTVEADGETLSVDVPVELGAPQVDGSSVSWPVLGAEGRAIDGVVLTAHVHPDGTGVTPVVEIADRAAFDELDEVAHGFAFEVGASAGLALAESGDGFTAATAGGVAIFEGGEPLQWDDAGGEEVGSDPEPTGAPVSTALVPADAVHDAGDAVVTMDVDIDPDGGSLVVSPDEAMISDPDTQWPVVIDPPISGITRSEWTVIRSNGSSKYKTQASEGVGLCDVQADSSCNADFKQRLLWEFTGMSKLKAIEPTDIVEASFSAYGTHSYDCSGNSLQLHLMASGISSSTTWSNQPDSKQRLDSQYPKHRSNCDGPGWITWDATEGAKDRAGSSTTMVLELKSPTESSMSSWRRYNVHTAKLAIEYNQAPGEPTSLTTLVNGVGYKCAATGTVIPTVTPKLQATAKDPDGQNLAVKFEILEASTSLWSVTDKAQSDALHTVSVPSSAGLLNGKTYKWRARAQDTDGRWSPTWGGWCYFSIDLSKPPAPEITPVTPTSSASNIKAVYDDVEERGGIGLTGCFRIVVQSTSPGVPPDVKSFRYSFGTTTFALSADARDGAATVCMPAGEPKQAGPSFIAALAVDAAGNLSPPGRYTYDVATAREDGVWTFDDRRRATPDESVREAGEAEGAGDLTFAATPTWLDGPHTLFQSRAGDFAPLFDGASTAATTSSPVIDSRQSFVVSAHVRLDEATKAHTVIAQDSAYSSAWRLGYQPTGCPMTGWSGGCWTFGLYSQDGSAVRAAYSPVKPVASRWTHVTGEYDQAAKRVRLWVCDIGTPDSPAAGQPVLAEAASLDPMWQASGPLTVGRAQTATKSTDFWKGAIDNVRIFKGDIVASAKVRRVCQGAEAGDFEGGLDVIDPTTTAQ